jgi:hypothetical protein
MSMFEIENADKVRLDSCSTDSESMLKASGKIGDFSASNCQAGGPSQASVVKETLSVRFRNYCLQNITAIVVGGCATVLGAVILTFLKLS